jgi:hypothetical protein
MELDVAVRRVEWKPCWRIIPTRLPRINVYDRIAPADDFAALDAVEQLTNERARMQARGSYGKHVAGDCGAEIILAPFAHPNPNGSRFSDGSYGVLYAARTLATSIAETRYHRERFLSYTDEPEMFLPMRAFKLDADGRFHDLRGRKPALRAVYSASSYAASQPLGRRLHEQGSRGLAYDSVRYDGGQCLAAFDPASFSRCRVGRELLYLWNGQSITDVLFLSRGAGP